MKTIPLGPGIAPDVTIVDDFVYVAAPRQNPHKLDLITLTLAGQEIVRRTLPGGFDQSFPRFSGHWLCYRQDEAHGFAATASHVQTGQTWTYGSAGGTFGLTVDASLGLVAYEWRDGAGPWLIRFGDLAGTMRDTNMDGAPDGLDEILSPLQVTLRKDTRGDVDGIWYPVRAGALIVGELRDVAGRPNGGIGVLVDGDVTDETDTPWTPEPILRVAELGVNTPNPRCATDDTVYATVCWGDTVRLLLGTLAEYRALPPVVEPPTPEPDPDPLPVPVPPAPPQPVPEPVPAPVPPTVPPMTDTPLHVGDVLRADEGRTSADGRFRVLMQGDGNVVVMRRDGTPLWATRTEGHSGALAVLQRDGNFVIYHDGRPVWASNTEGAGPSVLVVIQTDGNLVLYDDEGVARWASGVLDTEAPVPPSAPFPVPPGAPTRIRIDGRFFVHNAGTFRPCFQSSLTLLVRNADERAVFLDETVELGFNGIRVFAGALPWAPQTADQARAVLPTLLDEAAALGLYVYVVALTESRHGGYDVEAHLRAIATIVQAHSNALLEIANEPWHGTQSDEVNDPVRLLALARRAVPAGVIYALGAADTDEPDASGHYPTDGGAFNTSHLDRGRDGWNQVRRIREIENISAATHKPVMSGEPIGADEWMGGSTGTKQRRNDPPFFFALGALSRGFEIGTVFHSEAGLRSVPLGPVQRACAEAFIAGWRSIDTADRLRFFNARWVGSPVGDADFDRVVRAYSFVTRDSGWTVLVGITGDPAIRWGGDWHPTGVVVGEWPGVRVVEIAK